MVRLVTIALAACLASAAPAYAREKTAAPPPPRAELPWLVVERQTVLWSGPDEHATMFGALKPGTEIQLAEAQSGGRTLVWIPSSKNYAYVDPGELYSPNLRWIQDATAQPVESPLEPRVIWSGVARVTMYTCVELGGCGLTRSGIWPYEGVVAVDPRVIPLGSTVWVEGLGYFLAADTGNLVNGPHVDIFVNDYSRANVWGVQYLSVAAYENRR